jgi:hypothetical protein
MTDNTALVSKAKFKLIVLEEFTDDELRFTDSPIYHPQSHRILVDRIREEFETVPAKRFHVDCLK